MDQETSEIILFLGRFHPLVLHLPIGFLVIAFIMEILARFKRYSQYRNTLTLILLLGAISAILAAALGYMLAQAGGYNEELLFIHQWSGIALAFFAVAAFVLYRLSQKGSSVALDRFYFAFMILMMISLATAGHFGGSLTHGSNYLTEYMPNGLRNIVGLSPKKSREYQKIINLNEAKIFDDIVYPILDTRCISCHNENKSKGDLMLHTPEALLEGGEGGGVFVAGNPEQSELIKRIHLPITDKDHMPPDGKTQLTDEQTELLIWWIREGASFHKTVSEVTVDDEVQTILNTLVDSDANKSEVEILLSSETEPIEGEQLIKLRTSGVKVKPLAAKTNWLQVKLSPADSINSLMKKDLINIANQLTWLDLGSTDTTDEALASINQFSHLTRLHLENTLVTDQGLQNLKTLNYLEYLNLVGTETTDEGIKALANLKNLRKLYLWQTGVSKEGIQQLQEALPELEIHLGTGMVMENGNSSSLD